MSSWTHHGFSMSFDSNFLICYGEYKMMNFKGTFCHRLLYFFHDFIYLYLKEAF